MELRGEFKTYNEILDLLQIITMGKKSGEVNFRNDKENLTIVFKEGKIVDFSSNSPALQFLRERVVKGELPFDEAANFLFHHLAMWNSGKFSFTEKPIETEGIGSADTLNVMMNFTKEIDELPERVKEALKENAVFTLSEDAKLPITLDEEAWKILISVCKQMPIWSALLTSGRSFSEDVQNLNQLMKKRLIKPAERVEPEERAAKEEPVFVSEEIMEKVKELVVETMGPMGEFLIDETLEELEISRLPGDLIPKFVDTLIDKIPESCFVEGEKCKDRLRQQISGLLKGGSDEA